MTASVSDIYKRLALKAKQVIATFKKRSAQLGFGLQGLTELLSLNVGPSKWFQDIMKEALLLNYDIQRDPIMSSILYTMQLSQTLQIKKKAKILVRNSCVLIGVVDDRGLLGQNEVFC